MKVRKSAIALAIVLALVSTSLVAAQGTVVYVEPPTQDTYPGGQAVVEVWASEVTDFYGAQFTMTFSDTIVSGVSVAPGAAFTDYPDEYEVAVASVVSDTVNFAATLLRVPKAGPITGDVQLAIITFDALAVGTSPLTFGEVKLSDVAGEAIPFDVADGEIVVSETPTVINGYAYLEGRTDHSGIEVTLEISPAMTTTTDASGFYSFEGMPAGNYTITYAADLYLSAVSIDAVVLEGETNVLCDVTLLGGDLNNDGVIDILDLSLCAANFDTAASEADVNADGIVDVYDLVLVGKNFKLEAPTVYLCNG
jgi:hypothetical protein